MINLNRIIRKLKASVDLFLGNSKYSYSQFAEDILIDSLFNYLQIKNPTYLDIGTNKPKSGNNTYMFYLKKCYGVCVEPDLSLYKKIVKARPNDKVINAGVGIDDNTSATFYYFPEAYSGWNTFSKEDADKKQKQTGIKFKDDITVPFININTIIAENFESTPDFISIDVEGLDFEIVKSIDFNKNKPAVFCIETMEFNDNKLGNKDTDIINFLKSKGYIIYADTYINTIFVNKDLIN